MKKILITGGAGFIGSTLSRLLVLKGYNVTILDNFSEKIHGDNYMESFLFKKLPLECRIIKGDVRDKQLMIETLNSVDTIIHLAAETGTGQSMYDIDNYFDVNVMGTANILDIITNHKIKISKIILASSRSVYGEGKYLCENHGVIYPDSRKQSRLVNEKYDCYCPHCDLVLKSIPTDEKSWTNPDSIYAVTKLAQEQMIKAQCAALNIEYTILRFQNVYGAGQSLTNPYTGILSIFSRLLLENKEINIFEDGYESRDFINVEDVAEGIYKALITNFDTTNTVFNIGSGNSISVLEIAETLKKYYHSKSNIRISGDFRLGDIRHNKADVTYALEYLNWEPIISFEDGIKEFAEWVQSQKESYKMKSSQYDESLDELKERGLLVDRNNN